TAGRALEICDRRRRRRRRHDEGCLIDLEEIKYLKRYTPSTETRSVSAVPGGRTDGRHGLNSRLQEWSRLPEPYPPQAGYWCSRFARRPNVRLIWCGNDQIMEIGLRPWMPQQPTELCSCATESHPPLTRTSPCEDCCSPRVSPATSRCVAIDANGSDSSRASKACPKPAIRGCG